jgi:UDP:flavonoid glycosyltransferase YjiC (YdhE family)
VAGAARPGSVHSIPANDTQSHEAIAACDLVIAKAGYGTVAEAIAGRVPILAVPVEGSRESELIARTVGQLGVGLPYPSDAPWGQELFAEGARMLDDPGRYRAAYGRLPAEYAPGATDRLAATLLALARDPR